MSTPPRPRPDRDDDITGFHKADGSERWIDKFDGAGRPEASEFEEIKWTLKDDGSDRDGPWKHDGEHWIKLDRVTEAEPDGVGSSWSASTSSDVAAVETAMPAVVEIPELVLDDPTLDPTASPFSDDTGDAGYQALPELDASIEVAGSTDVGGEFVDG